MEGNMQKSMRTNSEMRKCKFGMECTYPNCRFGHPEGFKPNTVRRKFHRNTTEQQTKFLDAEENVCKIMRKIPIKCKINDELSESFEYCTDVTLRHVNKALAKKKLMTLDNRSFVTNGILNSYGKPHTVYSFFQAMSKNSFLTVEGSDTEIIIGIHPDYKAIITEKRSHIEKFSQRNRQVVPIESSSSEEEEEEEDPRRRVSEEELPQHSAAEPEPEPASSSEEEDS